MNIDVCLVCESPLIEPEGKLPFYLQSLAQYLHIVDIKKAFVEWKRFQTSVQMMDN